MKSRPKRNVRKQEDPHHSVNPNSSPLNDWLEKVFKANEPFAHQAWEKLIHAGANAGELGAMLMAFAQSAKVRAGTKILYPERAAVWREMKRVHEGKPLRYWPNVHELAKSFEYAYRDTRATWENPRHFWANEIVEAVKRETKTEPLEEVSTLLQAALIAESKPSSSLEYHETLRRTLSRYHKKPIH